MGKFKRTQEDVARAKEIIAVLLEKKIFTGASPEKVTETLTDLLDKTRHCLQRVL